MSARARRRSPSVVGMIAENVLPTMVMLALYLWAIASVTQHVVFWIAGVWIPWFVAIFGGLLGPVLCPVWFVFWVLHFTAIHFPLVAK